MGTCIHCGRSAGLFRSAHAQCAEIAQREEAARSAAAAEAAEAAERARRSARLAESNFSDEAMNMLLAGTDGRDIETRAAQLVEGGVLDFEARRRAVAQAWKTAVTHMLSDGLLTKAEEDSLMNTKGRFMLTDDELDGDGSYARVGLASTIRRLGDGEPPVKVTLPPNFPVNFQRGELPVYAFPRTEYLEDKDVRRWQGRSRGVSVRVISGVYARLGAFNGEPVITTERKHVDTGLLVFGTKNLYFVGPAKSLRVPFAKIISIERFSDGIGIHRDAASARPQFFKTGDGWAAYNIVAALSKGGEQS